MRRFCSGLQTLPNVGIVGAVRSRVRSREHQSSFPRIRAVSLRVGSAPPQPCPHPAGHPGEMIALYGRSSTSKHPNPDTVISPQSRRGIGRFEPRMQHQSRDLDLAPVTLRGGGLTHRLDGTRGSSPDRTQAFAPCRPGRNGRDRIRPFTAGTWRIPFAMRPHGRISMHPAPYRFRVSSRNPTLRSLPGIHRIVLRVMEDIIYGKKTGYGS